MVRFIFICTFIEYLGNLVSLARRTVKWDFFFQTCARFQRFLAIVYVRYKKKNRILVKHKQTLLPIREIEIWQEVSTQGSAWTCRPSSEPEIGHRAFYFTLVAGEGRNRGPGRVCQWGLVKVSVLVCPGDSSSRSRWPGEETDRRGLYMTCGGSVPLPDWRRSAETAHSGVVYIPALTPFPPAPLPLLHTR